MRKTWFALLAGLCLVPAAAAQPAKPGDAPATPTVDPTRDRLDFYLMRWEEAMKKVDSLALACSRTEVDKVYQTKKTLTGTIHFLKPTYFYWNMSVKDKPQLSICWGTPCPSPLCRFSGASITMSQLTMLVMRRHGTRL